MEGQRIAVIGSGISGLSSAWLLSQRHHVTLIEAGSYIGGHSNTVMCPVPEGKIAVDTGFIVYNDVTYPNLRALFTYLNVPTAAASMGFGVSLYDGGYEYSGAGVCQMIGHAGNLLRPQHWRMMADLIRFFRNAARQIALVPEDMTLEQFLGTHDYGRDFLELHLLPVAGAIWSSEPAQMLNYPARAFLRFFENHGLLNFVKRPQWRTVVGGSRAYVERMLEDGRIRTIINCAVHSVDRSGSRVIVRGSHGFAENFDDVVIATHADVALAMLDKPSVSEGQLLSRFTYSKNLASLHGDESLMPKRKRLWSSWNYVSDAGADGESASVTYWMNSLQPLPTATNLFVSINAKRRPAAEKVKIEVEYLHPIFNPKTRAAQQRLWDLQGVNKTWFCGAYFGAGFHEDGLQAGLAVAEQLGGVRRPWTAKSESGRIFVNDVLPHAPQFLEAAE